ncbi:MAG: hypothetical protein P8J32_09045 [bacterium]|nr:hypothetical protein [bacterium]
MEEQNQTTEEKTVLDEEFLEKPGVDMFADDELDDFDYDEYIKERHLMYLKLLEDNKYDDHSPFLIGDKSMRAVRKFKIKTSLGNRINLGDQLAGISVSIPGFYNIPDTTFFMIYKEDEVKEFAELVDNIWSDFVEDIAENKAVKWHDFYDEYCFMSMQEEYYTFFKNANNINFSHNILDYL